VVGEAAGHDRGARGRAVPELVGAVEPARSGAAPAQTDSGSDGYAAAELEPAGAPALLTGLLCAASFGGLAEVKGGETAPNVAKKRPGNGEKPPLEHRRSSECSRRSAAAHVIPLATSSSALGVIMSGLCQPRSSTTTWAGSSRAPSVSSASSPAGRARAVKRKQLLRQDQRRVALSP